MVRLQDQYNFTPQVKDQFQFYSSLKRKITKFKMAAQHDNMWMVESVLNSKIPELLEVMEKAKENSGHRMDATAFRLQEEIFTLVGKLQLSCRQMFRDRSFNEEEEGEEFDEMWEELNDLFKKFMDHCGTLEIFFDDVCCLVLTDDEISEENTTSSESEEEMGVEE